MVYLCVGLLAGCTVTKDGGTTPTPTPTGSAPLPAAPAEAEQLTTLRPTLRVTNASGGSGARTYEFQISDRSDFTASTGSSYYAVSVGRSGVAEGGGGSTSFTPDQDLQPATRFYWRARVAQGTSTSDWSAVRTLKTHIVGYSRAGELYDPLVNSETVGTRAGSTTFVAGRGIRLNAQSAFVMYLLGQTISAGEFSVDVEGLAPNAAGAKLKIMAMADDPGDWATSDQLMSAQYRGTPGNPDNCIAFKILFGGELFKLEPDLNQRAAAQVALSPTRTYHWKATWSNEFRLVVQDGGSGGTTIYNLGFPSGGGVYAPSPHYAFLGANVLSVEEGSYPNATIRNVWIGNKPRPASIGSALLP
jgi:hypothetical protein